MQYQTEPPEHLYQPNNQNQWNFNSSYKIKPGLIKLKKITQLGLNNYEYLLNGILQIVNVMFQRP